MAFVPQSIGLFRDFRLEMCGDIWGTEVGIEAGVAVGEVRHLEVPLKTMIEVEAIMKRMEATI